MPRHTKLSLNGLMLVMLGLCFASNANAQITMYDNSITAFNINAFQDVMASYAMQGESLSDFFKVQKMYGQMGKIDQYGDDGTTTESTKYIKHNDSIFKNIWTDFSTTGANLHFSGIGTKKSVMRLSSAGVNFKRFKINNGRLYLGVFGSYINADFVDKSSRGHTFEGFARYHEDLADFMIALNYGDLKTDLERKDMKNQWMHFYTNAAYRFYMDETFCIQTRLGLGYTNITSEDYYMNETDLVHGNNYNFINLTPEIRFIKEIVDDAYGVLYAKRFISFGGKNEITVNDTQYQSIDLDNYNEVGIDAEYHIRRFVLTGGIHKQIGYIDGWNGSFNFKYEF